MIINLNLVAQRNEVALNYQYGFAVGGNKSVNSSIENISKNDKLYSLNDQLYQIEYSRKFSEKFKLWVTFNGAYGIRKDCFYIFTPSEILDKPTTSVSRTELGLGLQKSFSYLNDKLLFKLGMNLIYRQQNFDIIESSTNYYTKTDDSLFMQYQYNFLSRTDTFPSFLYIPRLLNPKFTFEAQYKLYKNLNFKIGLSYSLNNTVYYKYQTKIYDAKTNYAYPSQIFEQRANRQNYLYVSCGLTYLFDWKKIDSKSKN